MRRVKLRDSTEHSSSQNVSICLPIFHALEKSCTCPNCPVAGASPRRKCWVVTCLTVALAGIKTSASGDRNRRGRGSSNSAFQLMLRNRSSAFKAESLCPTSVSPCLHSPRSAGGLRFSTLTSPRLFATGAEHSPCPYQEPYFSHLRVYGMETEQQAAKGHVICLHPQILSVPQNRYCQSKRKFKKYKRRGKQPLGHAAYEPTHTHGGKPQKGPEHMLDSNYLTAREISSKTQREEMRRK